jgi:voltage-gated potassium channel
VSHPLLRRVADRYLRLGFKARHALELIVIVTTILTVVSGVVIWLVDPTAFPTIGAGLWWALQTVTTVGYGDHLPSNSSGRAVAVVVMLSGIAFLTVATGAITAVFLEATRRRFGAGQQESVEREIALMREELERLRADLRASKE